MTSQDDIKDLSEDLDESLSKEEAAAVAGGLGSLKAPNLGAIGTANVAGRTQVTHDAVGDVDS